MGRLAQTDGLTEFEQDILATVRDFTVKEIIPVATELEHRDEYPAQIVEGMKQLGLFGLTIPERYDGLGASLLLYALVVEEIARGCGVALRAFELAIAYAQQRHTFGQPIAQHQAIAFKLAEMATKVEAAHQMMVMAARRKDSGHRNDLEAGMAKYLASEYGKEVVEDAFRIHGGYGFSKEYEIERLYREAPMLLIGEGTAEIQKMIVGRRLLEEYQVTG